MISSIVQIANTKLQILASNNQIREHRIETKTNHYTIKILITEINIYTHPQLKLKL